LSSSSSFQLPASSFQQLPHHQKKGCNCNRSGRAPMHERASTPARVRLLAACCIAFTGEVASKFAIGAYGAFEYHVVCKFMFMVVAVRNIGRLACA
jgi:hypothetical protein